MRQRFTWPVRQVIFGQGLVLIGVSMILFFLAQPSTGFGATDGLRLSTTIDTGYGDSAFPEERFLEVVVTAPQHRPQRMIPFPPPPPFGLEALFDPSGRVARRMVKELRHAQHSPGFVAKNVKVDVHIGRQVCIDEVFGDRFEQHGNTVTFHAGRLDPGESRRFLIRLRTNPRQPGAYKIGRVKMSYTQAGHGQRVSQVQRLTMQYRRNGHPPRFSTNHGGAKFVFYGTHRGRTQHPKMEQERYRDRRGYAQNRRAERGERRY